MIRSLSVFGGCLNAPLSFSTAPTLEFMLSASRIAAFSIGDIKLFLSVAKIHRRFANCRSGLASKVGRLLSRESST